VKEQEQSEAEEKNVEGIEEEVPDSTTPHKNNTESNNLIVNRRSTFKKKRG
jgi:hypothetical protein